jgi:hypothetical protein
MHQRHIEASEAGRGNDLTQKMTWKVEIHNRKKYIKMVDLTTLTKKPCP